MESKPQVPKKSHSKSISVTSTIVNDVGNISRSDRRQNAGVELVPKPSDSPLDPLNWPQWRKELAFASLILGSAVIGILKTVLVTVNGPIATELNCSYMAAAALTGLPLIMGAVSGLGSTVLSEKIGKRGIYLFSSVLLLLGALWNMHVSQSYAQFMISRLFQGFAWGAFETLIPVSVKDMYFVHERSSRAMIYNVSNILFTWGTPIVGGYLSQSRQGFRNQIMATNIIQAVSIVLLIFATPETTFARSSSLGGPHSTVTTTVSAPSSGKFRSYLSTLRIITPNSASKSTLSSALLPLRALAAPSAILTFLLTAPLMSTAFAIASTLSLIFSSMPIFLFPARVGYLFIGPLLFSLVFFSLASLTAYLTSRPPKHLTASRHLATSIPGLVIGFAGLLAFGIYTYDQLMAITLVKGSVFSLYTQGQDLSLKSVSVLFGLLVSGAILTNFSGVMHLKSSTTTAELEVAHKTLQDILAGIFVIGMPLWVKGGEDMLAGLKDAVIALGVVQIVIGSSVGALLWAKGDMIRKMDGRVLGRKMEERNYSLERTKTTDSFFEA